MTDLLVPNLHDQPPVSHALTFNRCIFNSITGEEVIPEATKENSVVRSGATYIRSPPVPQ